MNKSTPLSQLPNANQPQNAFVNEQQKQMVTNAQTAVQNIPIPQNTQIPPEIMNDDDATIQEVLNQINSQKQQQPSQAMQGPPPSMYDQMPPQMRMMPPPPDPSEFGGSMPPFPYPPPPNMVFGGPGAPIPAQPGQSIDVFMNFFADDLKLAFIVMSVFILVSFIPIGGILGRYIAIDRIPYHDIILKALFCAVIVIFAKKMITPK